jgi:hypothetical protein
VWLVCHDDSPDGPPTEARPLLAGEWVVTKVKVRANDGSVSFTLEAAPEFNDRTMHS